MVCAECGKEIEIYASDEGHQCHICENIFCNECMPRWEIVEDELVCKNCAEDEKLAEALPDFGDIICSRGSSGIQTNVPRRIVLHSPTGFGWGYGGSGPADFALNILSIFIGQAEAEKYYQDFKFDVVAKIPYEGGTIKREDILNWIEAKRKEAGNG